jgi:hypothetical protein
MKDWNKKIYYVPGDILISFMNGISEEEINGILKLYNLTKVQQFKTGTVLLHVPVQSEIYWVCVLKENKKVRYVEPNLIIHSTD